MRHEPVCAGAPRKLTGRETKSSIIKHCARWKTISPVSDNCKQRRWGAGTEVNGEGVVFEKLDPSYGGP
jgi:hypothetical protein